VAHTVAYSYVTDAQVTDRGGGAVALSAPRIRSLPRRMALCRAFAKTIARRITVGLLGGEERGGVTWGACLCLVLCVVATAQTRPSATEPAPSRQFSRGRRKTAHTWARTAAAPCHKSEFGQFSKTPARRCLE